MKLLRNEKKIFLLSILLFNIFSFNMAKEPVNNKKVVYVFKIYEEIRPSALRNTKKSFEEAEALKADYIILNLNTYGGMVNIADSIRTIILNSKIPVFVFINNNAASAGALISIAADSIYMRKGSTIGAASVVNQAGEIMPEKYQSFMRAKMRATAESHGKDTIILNGDTTYRWHRNPLIAEGMVDPRVSIPGIIDSSKIISFTTDEAVRYGYCEGIAEDINEVIAKAGIKNYEIKEYKMSSLENLISFLLHPMMQSILIMLIIGGIYFELQTPGIGFPLIAALFGAILYLAPLYLESLAANWELVIFFVGLILVAIEIFAIPGFGVAGISGIVFIIIGLSLSMIDNVVFEMPGITGFNIAAKSFLLVIVSIFISFIASIYLSKKLFTSLRFPSLALQKTQDVKDGYISVNLKTFDLVGKTGTSHTMLRPGGKVDVDGEIFDAIAIRSYINAGEKVIIIKFEKGQLYVEKEVNH